MGRNLCDMHYQRWRSTGDVGQAKPLIILGSIEERFWAKVQKTDGCWIWIGTKDGRQGKGYGHFGGKGAELKAHRQAYVLANGAIPKGMQVHHACANPICVNPDHLVLATQTENLIEMNARRSYEQRIKHLEAENAALRARVAELEADRLRAAV